MFLFLVRAIEDRISNLELREAEDTVSWIKMMKGKRMADARLHVLFIELIGVAIERRGAKRAACHVTTKTEKGGYVRGVIYGCNT